MERWRWNVKEDVGEFGDGFHRLSLMHFADRREELPDG